MTHPARPRLSDWLWRLASRVSGQHEQNEQHQEEDDYRQLQHPAAAERQQTHPAAAAAAADTSIVYWLTAANMQCLSGLQLTAIPTLRTGESDN